MVFNLGMKQRPETATLSSTFLWHYSVGFTWGCFSHLKHAADEIVNFYILNKSFWAVLSCGTVYYVVKRGFHFYPLIEILKCGYLTEWNSVKQYVFYKVLILSRTSQGDSEFYVFKSVDKNPKSTRDWFK